MPDSAIFHCASCGARPPVNLVPYAGKLTRPECLYEINARQAAHQALASAPPDAGPGWLAAALAMPESPAIVAEPLGPEPPHAPHGITLVTHTDNWSRLNREDRETADGYRHAARNVLRALSAAKLGPA